MKKSDKMTTLLTPQEWMYVYKVLENTQVLGKEIKPFSQLMSKIDIIICDLMESQQKAPLQNGIPTTNAISDTSSLNEKIA